MKSRYAHLRSHAEKLRTQGESISLVEERLGIPRSTLSGWFKHIQLSEVQKQRLLEHSQLGLKRARTKAAESHREIKRARTELLEQSAHAFLEKVDVRNRELLEITLAVLYLGEGSKKNPRTAMGASDPLMIRFFVHCLITLYEVPVEKIKCELHLRYDQDEVAMKKYWSKKLSIPFKNFTKTSFDARTAGKPTYDSYKGVCLVNCGRVDIQRRLMYIAKGFCIQASDPQRAISSVG